MTNKEKFEQYKTFFNNNKLHVKDVTWLTGYFVFELGEDSVVHFHIKELKGWKFSVWFNEGFSELFWQYDKDIDKFKPSASYFAHKIEDDKLEGLAHLQITRDYEFYESITKDLTICFYTDLARMLGESLKVMSKQDITKSLRKQVYQELWDNFTGDVYVEHKNSGLYMRAKGKPFPFKGLWLFLRYGKRVNFY
jgi:hypothetical protein